MPAAFGMPGYLELLIVGLICLGVVVAPVVVLAVVLLGHRKTSSVQADNPNLEPCPDCGHFVSIRAASCPQCGCPTKNG